MKQYIYEAADVGLKEWPSGTLRFEGMDVTTDPEAADIFVCPGPLLLFQDPADLDRFPHMAAHERRHVFFDCSDWDTVYARKDCILIRCNLKAFMYAAHPNSIPWVWPVEDFAECVQVPKVGFSFDVSFQGWLSTRARRDASQACREHPALTCDVATYMDFCGYIYHEPEGIRRRGEFRRSMRESRIALCPESIPGVLPYRFFEALSAGRVPLLVGTDYTLPFTDEIDYDRFILRCAADRAEDAGDIAAEAIRTHTDADWIRMGREARENFLRWLNRDDWPRTMTYAVRKKLDQLGLNREDAVPCGS